MIEHNHQHVDVHADEKAIGRPPAVAQIRKALAQARVLGIRIIGHPGSGKTDLIEATLKRLASPQRVAVIVVNPASGRDAEKLRKLCGHVTHIDAAIPDAAPIWKALSEVNLEHFDTLLIEAAGGLAPLRDLGQDATVAVFAVSGGDDKALEYRTLLKSTSAVLLTKIDLRALVKFDSQVFRNDIQGINPVAEVHEVSSITGFGMPEWLGWIERSRAAKAHNRSRGDPSEASTDAFIG